MASGGTTATQQTSLTRVRGVFRYNRLRPALPLLALLSPKLVLGLVWGETTSLSRAYLFVPSLL